MIGLLILNKLKKKLQFWWGFWAFALSSWANFKTALWSILTQSIVATGRVCFEFCDEVTGTRHTEWSFNLVVASGKAHIADQLSGQTQAQIGWMAIGTGATPAAAGDIALESELSRKALTSLEQGTGENANQVIYVADWGVGEGTGAITEAGMFNLASAGIMLCRSVFAVKNKGESDSLTLTWYLTISS